MLLCDTRVTQRCCVVALGVGISHNPAHNNCNNYRTSLQSPSHVTCKLRRCRNIVTERLKVVTQRYMRCWSIWHIYTHYIIIIRVFIVVIKHKLQYNAPKTLLSVKVFWLAECLWSESFLVVSSGVMLSLRLFLAAAAIFTWRENTGQQETWETGGG